MPFTSNNYLLILIFIKLKLIYILIIHTQVFQFCKIKHSYSIYELQIINDTLIKMPNIIYKYLSRYSTRIVK